MRVSHCSHPFHLYSNNLTSNTAWFNSGWPSHLSKSLAFHTFMHHATITPTHIAHPAWKTPEALHWCWWLQQPYAEPLLSSLAPFFRSRWWEFFWLSSSLRSHRFVRTSDRIPVPPLALRPYTWRSIWANQRRLSGEPHLSPRNTQHALKSMAAMNADCFGSCLYSPAQFSNAYYCHVRFIMNLTVGSQIITSRVFARFIIKSIP